MAETIRPPCGMCINLQPADLGLIPQGLDIASLNEQLQNGSFRYRLCSAGGIAKAADLCVVKDQADFVAK